MNNPFEVIEARLSNIETLILDLKYCDKSDFENDKEQCLTIQEASDFLSLKVPTLYQKVSKREIPFLKRSKRLYFKREDLIEYLEKGRVKSVSEVQEEAESLFKRGGANNGK